MPPCFSLTIKIDWVKSLRHTVAYWYRIQGMCLYIKLPHATETMQHCLVCPLLPNQCSLKDLAEFNNKAKDCVKKWETVI